MSDMTPEKAQALLDGATPGPLAICEDRTCWMTITGLSFKIGAPLFATDLTLEDRVQRLADAHLIAASPDLARAYIAQADEITRLEAEFAMARTDADLTRAALRLAETEIARLQARLADAEKLVPALIDALAALEKFVDTSTETRQPHDHPLSAYDRGQAALSTFQEDGK
jgi:hypothetical protein